MDEFVATCVQQQIRIFESHGEFRSDIQRFMRLAKVKDSKLVVFPELAGLMLAPPLVPGLKRTLLRVAERQVKRKPSIFDRMVGRMAGSASDALGGIAGGLLDAFTQHADTLRDAYVSIFSEIARENEMYVIGGSIYLPDPRDGQIRNVAYVFSPTGEVIGQQAKITLTPTDAVFCRPADTGLQTVDTEFGRLGILIGQDVLYPESGRVLGALGASAVVHMVAAAGLTSFARMKNAFAARLQENLFLGAQSCLVGKNILSPKEGQADYAGRSALLAPAEMTTRYTGLLAEVGSTATDGVISATWDLKGLHDLRQKIDYPVHTPLGNRVLREQMQAIYGEGPVPVPEPRVPDAVLQSQQLAVEPSDTASLRIPGSDTSQNQGASQPDIPEAPKSDEDRAAIEPFDWTFGGALSASVLPEAESAPGPEAEPEQSAASAVPPFAWTEPSVPTPEEHVWPELEEFAPSTEPVESPEEESPSSPSLLEPPPLPTSWEPDANVSLDQPETEPPPAPADPWLAADVEPLQSEPWEAGSPATNDENEDTGVPPDVAAPPEVDGSETSPESDSTEDPDRDDETEPELRNKRWWER